jgi:hypothetical protein
MTADPSRAVKRVKAAPSTRSIAEDPGDRPASGSLVVSLARRRESWTASILGHVGPATDLVP